MFFKVMLYLEQCVAFAYIMPILKNKVPTKICSERRPYVDGRGHAIVNQKGGKEKA